MSARERNKKIVLVALCIQMRKIIIISFRYRTTDISFVFLAGKMSIFY